MPRPLRLRIIDRLHLWRRWPTEALVPVVVRKRKWRRTITQTTDDPTVAAYWRSTQGIDEDLETVQANGPVSEIDGED